MPWGLRVLQGPPASSLPRTKALVLELLAAVCLVRGGHDIILSAFDNFKEVMEPPPNVYLFGALLLAGVASAGGS